MKFCCISIRQASLAQIFKPPHNSKNGCASFSIAATTHRFLHTWTMLGMKNQKKDEFLNQASISTDPGLVVHVRPAATGTSIRPICRASRAHTVRMLPNRPLHRCKSTHKHHKSEAKAKDSFHECHSDHDCGFEKQVMFAWLCSLSGSM